MEEKDNEEKRCSSLKAALYWFILSISIIFGIVGIVLLVTSTRRRQTQTQAEESLNGKDNGKEGPSHGKPNILFIMLDDLGYNDVSWHNPTVHMPVMDKLAREGVILDRSYSHCVCSPSRAEFQTGYYAHRLGVHHWVLEPNQASYLKSQGKSLPESLKSIGYSTNLIGKWHLGFCRKGAWPTSNGFDTFYGMLTGYLDSYTHCSSSRFKNDTALAWVDNNVIDPSQQGIHATDLIKLRTKSIIEKSDGSKPLFMHMSFFAPHVPVQSPIKYLQHYKDVNNTWRQEYLGMISHVDDAVGEVVQSLKDKGIYDNTIIVMQADNGGDLGPSSNYPFRGGKTSVYEGGTRVPAFISGPGLKQHVSKERFHMTDWFPTLMKLAGSQDLNRTDLDGIDQSEMLTKGAPTKRREMVYRIDTEEPVSFGYASISYDNYKLILRSPGYADGWEQDGTLGIPVRGGEFLPVKRHLRWAERKSDKCPLARGLPYNFTLYGLSSEYGATLTDKVALYDLEADPEERNDLAATMSEKVDELTERLNRHIPNQLQSNYGPYYSHITQRDDYVWYNRWCEEI